MYSGTTAYSAPPAEGMEERFHAALYLGLQSLRGRPVGECMEQLRRWERLDRRAFRALCRERLAAALMRARDEVPLYSEEPWRSALRGREAECIEAWPVLERDVVRHRKHELLARHRPLGAFYRRSSATSGAPLAVAYDPQAAAWSWASEYRAGLWHGIPVGAKTLKLWGGRHSVLDWIRNSRVFNARELPEERLDEAARWLLAHRPDVLMGLSSAVARLARHVRAYYPDDARSLCRWAKVGGEQVYPFEREEIERHLGARVLNFYGCTEVGAVSAECPAGSLHVHAEVVHVEVLQGDQPAPPGEEGDIVLTSLVNRAMPLVRCRVGDRGVLSDEPCRCGLPQPVLLRIMSRAADLFVAADGRLVHGSELARGLDACLAAAPPGAVGQVLFRQRDPRHWDVLVEARDGFDERLARTLEAMVHQTFGSACRVALERVPTVPREASGKFRYYARAGAGEAVTER
jgi:phenylacetate-CoA ligase